MKRMDLWSSVACVAVVLLAGVAIAAGPVTISGTINSEYQLVAPDGQVYELDVAEDADGAVLDDLTEKIDKKVQVKGTVEKNDYGEKVLLVISYKVIGSAVPGE